MRSEMHNLRVVSEKVARQLWESWGQWWLLIIGMRAAKLLQIIEDKTWVEYIFKVIVPGLDFYFKIDKAIGYLSSIGVWSW